MRQRTIRRAAQAGITVETRARFGFTAAPESTDDPRMRRITEAVDPATTTALLAAYQAGADEQQLRAILAAGLGQAYFRDHGHRAQGLDVAINAIDYIDLDLT
ncbi:telomere-protecting terminal protein Tpg [Streptomyces sp. 6N223]|uniref:telomere-protecting terminal protein Tpg n=1 Tax=Streptomyces sp. 6N223 TaxID=3457412 RepID=UPI003FD53047